MAKQTKEQIANDVVRLLSIDPVRMSSGSTVISDALDRIHAAITGRPTIGMTAHQKVAAILEALSLTYDPHWDTSKGSTVTVRAYSRMLVALTGRPRCLVVDSIDAAAENAQRNGKTLYYPYDKTFVGTTNLNEAGPGSLVLFCNRNDHRQNPRSYVATARVEYISPGWKGPWTAELSGFRKFDTPVRADFAEAAKRYGRNTITEITWRQYQEIVAAGTGTRPESDDVGAGLDVGGERIARGVALDFPTSAVMVVGDAVPARRTNDSLDPSPEREPAYTDRPAEGGLVRIPPGRRSASDRERDKIVEERAVALATKHLQNLGWRVVADRQKDGVGYDIEFTDGVRTMHLEVKGIQGPRLAFNLTAKEWWRARTDPDFVLAGVTDVLSPTKVHVSLLGPAEIVAADRAATQFRVEVRGR